MRMITAEQRRRAIVLRHHLAGDARDPEAATRAVVALHASDPASVYVSVLARSAASTLSDVADAMYVRRSLVRWMAMRRTLFVFAREDIALVQAAVSTPVAETLRRALVSRLSRNGSEPPIDGDIGRWIADLEDRVERALARRGSASGTQLANDDPALRTLIRAKAPSDRPQNLTTPLLTLMSAEGRIVRGVPDRGMDKPTPPLGTDITLVGARTTVDRPGGRATGPRAPLAAAIRTGEDRRPAVVDRMEQDHHPSRSREPRDRGGRPARPARDHPPKLRRGR